MGRIESRLSKDTRKDIKEKMKLQEPEDDGRDTGSWKKQDFVSPLVLLLKLARDKVPFSSDQDDNDWGPLRSIQNYLQNLNLKEVFGQLAKYHPGVPKCIFAIVPVWTSQPLVISASVDSFSANDTLYQEGRTHRTAHLKHLEESYTTPIRKKISELASSSKRFVKEYKIAKEEQSVSCNEEMIARFKRDSRLTKIHLPGIVVTWGPSGTYKPACLLDYCRFHILRPPKAEKLEQNQWTKKQPKGVDVAEWSTNKTVWPFDACAEWAGFLELAKDSATTQAIDATQW